MCILNCESKNEYVRKRSNKKNMGIEGKVYASRVSDNA